MVRYPLYSLRNKTELFTVLKNFAILTKGKLFFLFHKKFLRDDISKLMSYSAERYFYKIEDLLKKFFK